MKTSWSLTSPNQRASEYLKVSLRTVSTKDSAGRLKTSEEECVVDSFDRVAVHRNVKQFCIEQKIMPVLNKLLDAVN
jgi:hypothetical protein